MYELFQAFLDWGDEPAEGEATLPAPADTPGDAQLLDLDQCFEAVEQQLFDPS